MTGRNIHRRPLELLLNALDNGTTDFSIRYTERNAIALKFYGAMIYSVNSLARVKRVSPQNDEQVYEVYYFNANKLTLQSGFWTVHCFVFGVTKKL